jgi:hypothetical protein
MMSQKIWKIKFKHVLIMDFSKAFRQGQSQSSCTQTKLLWVIKMDNVLIHVCNMIVANFNS